MAKFNLEYRFRKNYKWLNDMLLAWGGKLFAANALCIAISRKAPRLLEWCMVQLSGSLSTDFITTEIALPFLDLKEFNKYIVTDEAIYHGTTFEKVLQMVVALVGDKGKVMGMPFVVTDEALESDAIVESFFDSVTVIFKEDCNFLVDTIISKFNELGKPYDIEYPLFYLDVDSQLSSEDIKDFLNRSFEEFEDRFYMTSCYQTETRTRYEHFTLLTDFVYDQPGIRVKPDLAKLRFFFTKGRLCVVSMSPFVINECDICLDTPLFHGPLLDIWQSIYKSVSQGVNDENILYQRNKSLVILANYLLSFEQFLMLQPLLRKYLEIPSKGQLSFRLDKFDLQLLVGSKLANSLVGQLQALLRGGMNSERDWMDFYTPLSGHLLDGVFPQKYEQQYRLQVSLDNMLAEKTISNMMSNMFSNMHWLVELKSREYSRDEYGRLRFGESLRSMLSEFGRLASSKIDVLRKTHENLDFRIDLGSVVPNYVRQKLTFDTYWQRLFRCGENEDLRKDRYFRVIVNLLSEYLQARKGKEILESELELLMALLVHVEEFLGEETDEASVVNRYFEVPTSSIFKDGKWRLCIKIDDENTFDIIERAEKYGIIEKRNDFFYALTASDYVDALKGSLALDDANERYLKRIAQYVIQFYKEKPFWNNAVKELSNYVCFDYDSFNQAFQVWLKEMHTVIDFVKTDKIEELENEWVDFYYNLPDSDWVKEGDDGTFDNINDWISNRISAIRTDGRDVNLLCRLHGAFYLLNLFSKSKKGVVSTNYDDFMLYDFKSYLLKCNPNDALADELPRLNGDVNLRNMDFSELMLKILRKLED